MGSRGRPRADLEINFGLYWLQSEILRVLDAIDNTIYRQVSLSNLSQVTKPSNQIIKIKDILFYGLTWSRVECFVRRTLCS